MTRALRSELVKVLRRRVLVVGAVIVVVFAFGAAAIVISSAEPSASSQQAEQAAVTLDDLNDAGGGTEVFTAALSFAGFFVFVVFVGAVAVEFGRGTFRTMLLRQPHRTRLLAGKMAALLIVAAGILAATEALTWVAAHTIAPSQDITTRDWMSFTALGDAVADFGTVMFWVTGYAVLGATIAILIRSVPIAFAVAIAWAGPTEHIIGEAWDPATRLFPGLLLEAFVVGGTDDVDASRAALTLAAYIAAGAAIAAANFARRDVTG
jgi:ABC-2 type transport system permease protein